MNAWPDPKKVLQKATDERMQLDIVLPKVPAVTVTDETELEKQARRRKSLSPRETVPSDLQHLPKFQNEEMGCLLAENEQLKSNLGKCIMELRRKNESLLVLKENLQRMVRLSRTQETAFYRLNRLKDETSVAQQIAAETQLRQLNEIQTLTLTDDYGSLKQKFIKILDQQSTTTEACEEGMPL